MMEVWSLCLPKQVLPALESTNTPSLGPPPPSFPSSHLTHEEEAIFVLGNTAGQLTVVKMSRVRGFTSVNQLAAPSSVLGRVWTSLTSSLATQERQDQPLSCAITNL